MIDRSKNWVVVAAIHGDKYFGYCQNWPKDTSEGISLHCARQLIAEFNSTPQGVQHVMAILPIDGNDGPKDCIVVIPSCWYSIAPHDSAWSEFERLVAACENFEHSIRARRVGIATPGIILPGVKS